MRHPLIPVLTLVTSIATSLFTTAAEQDANAPGRDSLSSDEAYILVDMGTRGALKRYVSSLQFNGSSLDYALSIPKTKGVQVMKVKAGTYRPTALGLTANARPRDTDKALVEHFEDPDAQEKSLVIEPGTVTFIGRWDVAYGKSFTFADREHISKDLAYRVRYPIENLQGYAEENPWLTQFPLRVSHISGKNAVATWRGIGVERLN